MIDATVNLAGLALIVFFIWWFWLARPRAVAAGSGPIEVLVEHGTYRPARIEVPAGQAATLRFVRKDPSPCAEKVLFDDLGIAVTLPLDEPLEVTVTPPQPGEYIFTCDMRMYRGSLIAH